MEGGGKTVFQINTISKSQNKCICIALFTILFQISLTENQDVNVYILSMHLADGWVMILLKFVTIQAIKVIAILPQSKESILETSNPMLIGLF